jgi:hypothetical protein
LISPESSGFFVEDNFVLVVVNIGIVGTGVGNEHFSARFPVGLDEGGGFTLAGARAGRLEASKASRS